MRLSIVMPVLAAAMLAARQYLVNYQPPLTVGILAVLFVGGVTAFRGGNYLAVFLAVGGFLSGLARLCSAPYTLNLLFVLFTAAWTVVFMWGCSRAAAAGLFLVSAAAVLDAFSGSFYIRFMQSPLQFNVTNSYASSPSEKTVLVSGGSLTSNIPYADTYPNSRLDIYLSPDNASGPCPTFIFVHGGGFTWGDKVDGDPNGGEGGGQKWYFEEFLKSGYNIVSVNYALAPDYSYPVPMQQLGEAAQFLTEHAEEYGLDMSRTVYSGGSAGGAIVGQFVLAQLDPAYANRTGIPRTVAPDSIKAVVFASALLDGKRYYKTGSIGFDFMLNECGRVFYGEDFVRSEMIADTDIAANLNASFPPVYLSDGNQGSFTDQAADLYRQLENLGITAQFTWYDRSVEELGHGFEIFATPCGRDNLEKTLEFLDRNVKDEE